MFGVRTSSTKPARLPRFKQSESSVFAGAVAATARDENEYALIMSLVDFLHNSTARYNFTLRAVPNDFDVTWNYWQVCGLFRFVRLFVVRCSLSIRSIDSCFAFVD